MPGELHQISLCTNGETTPAAGDATGVLRCEPEAFAERQSCHLNGDRDIGAKRQPSAGEIRGAGNADTSVGCDVDTAPYRLFVKAWWHAGECDRIRNQDGSLKSLRPDHRLESVGRKMMAISDEGCGQSVIRELAPQKIGVPGQGGRGTVA